MAAHSSHPQPPARVTDTGWSSALAQHDRWLRTVVYARVGESDAVDEVMQEVSLAAMRQASSESPREWGPWLYRVAIRQALLFRRKLGRRRRLNARYRERQGAVGESPAEPSPLEWLLADERRQLIRRALGRLPRRDREILLLKYTEEWNYRQIAAHLGISQSAVEARLHRARRRMRDELMQAQVIETPA